MTRHRSIRGVLVVTAIVTLGMGGARTAYAAEPAPAHGADQAKAHATLLAAIGRDLHLSPAQTDQLLARQTQVSDLEQAMAGKLGQDYGGSWFDQRTGKLVVAATSADRAALAASAATSTVVVKHSMRTLNGLKADLDTLARSDHTKLLGASAWGVDVTRNQVMVTARPGQAKALTALMAKYGDAVRVEESSLTPTTTADFLDGGDPFANNTRGLLCSVGFNVSRAGVNYFLTAGHCGQPGDVTSQNGVFIGPFEQSVFPTSDEALVRNDNTGFWIQGPWVFAYTGDPNAVFNLSGFRDSPVGTPICKSGITTQVTCGSVTVKDESVNAFDQNGNFLGTIFGLTRHTACAEPGDSGGSNFSFDNTGNFAEGTTSLSSLDGAGHCGEHQNPPVQSTAWFFPVADEISSFGVTLMTL